MGREERQEAGRRVIDAVKVLPPVEALCVLDAVKFEIFLKVKEKYNAEFWRG